MVALRGRKELKNSLGQRGYPDAVGDSLQVLEKAGLIVRDGRGETSHSAPVAPANSSAVELTRLVELGHRLLNMDSVTSHWPELAESRERAFETFRLIARSGWTGEFVAQNESRVKSFIKTSSTS